jgi:hypothetical protein
VTGLPIKDDRPGSLRTESIELPQGKGAARAARAAVDTLTRDLGELYHDVRLLVSELVTTAADGMNEAVRLRVELSISRVAVRVVVRYEDTGGIVTGLEPPVVGQWTHMLLDALTSAWGTGDDGDACLWFEMGRG